MMLRYWFASLLIGLVSLGGMSALAANVTQSSYALRDEAGATLLVATEKVFSSNNGVRRETIYSLSAGDSQKEVYEVTSDGGMRRYGFDDPGSGEAISVEDDGDGWLVTYRADSTVAPQSTRLGKGARVLHGKAIPQLILAEWTPLAAGKSVEFDLIVPQRLTTYKFRIRRLNDEAQPVFVVDAANWFIRQFAPTLRFRFSDEESRQVILFEGPAAPRISGEPHRAVTIDFARDA